MTLTCPYWTVHIVQCWVPPGKSTLIVPQGNSVSPVGYEIIMTSELVILFDAECPWGSQLPLCPMGNIVTMFNGQFWLYPRETEHLQLNVKYHHQWTGHIVRCWVPLGKSIAIVPQGNIVTMFNGQFWLYPRETEHLQLNVKYHHPWTGHIVKCWMPSGNSPLPLCPRGIQYQQLALK